MALIEDPKMTQILKREVDPGLSAKWNTQYNNYHIFYRGRFFEEIESGPRGKIDKKQLKKNLREVKSRNQKKSAMKIIQRSNENYQKLRDNPRDIDYETADRIAVAWKNNPVITPNPAVRNSQGIKL